ncbi:MAG: hypothetical protein H6707_12310 [Deltaproteobacteria bacterium]|nr:hypothetical protein [Deltaproteobacteria bacterium]
MPWPIFRVAIVCGGVLKIGVGVFVPRVRVLVRFRGAVIMVVRPISKVLGESTLLATMCVRIVVRGDITVIIVVMVAERVFSVAVLVRLEMSMVVWVFDMPCIKNARLLMIMVMRFVGMLAIPKIVCMLRDPLVSLRERFKPASDIIVAVSMGVTTSPCAKVDDSAVRQMTMVVAVTREVQRRKHKQADHPAPQENLGSSYTASMSSSGHWSGL